MKHTGIINTSLTQAQGFNEVVLFSPRSKLPVLPLGNEYIYHIRYDLQSESRLTQSLSISVVPPINPEDSQYKKFAKWQTATAAAQKIILHFKSRKYQATVKTLELLNFGGTWREVITQSEFLEWDDELLVQATQNTVAGTDYINLTGNFIIEIDSIPKDNLYATPKNFGETINNTPTLIRASNGYRARLHLQNTGTEIVHLAFGKQSECVPGQCLALSPGAVWNDERMDKAIISSSVWGMVESTETTGQVVGVEVNWL